MSKSGQEALDPTADVSWQLSRDELTLLAFNLLFDDEGIKMRALIYKYGLLKPTTSCANMQSLNLRQKLSDLAGSTLKKLQIRTRNRHAD